MLDKQQKLEEIAKKVVVCQKCALYETANRVAPGEGNPEAEIMFIGEAPGFFEDKRGRPFIGQAGRLLDSLLQLIKVRREDFWIGNLIKHRPPCNRDPSPGEIEACSSWIDKQIEIISPKVVIALGRFSMAKFISGEKISNVYGKKFMVEFGGRKMIIIPMYHPVAGLRNVGIPEALKSDFSKLGQLI